MSELFFFESTFSMMHVLLATFSLSHTWASSWCRKLRVMRLASDANTQLSSWFTVGCWIHPTAFTISLFEMMLASRVWLTASISDARQWILIIHCLDQLNTSKWLTWPLSWLPPRSASHWILSCRIWVILLMSVDTSWAQNLRRFSFAYLQYLSSVFPLRAKVHVALLLMLSWLHIFATTCYWLSSCYNMPI